MADTAIFDVDGTLVDTNYQHALAWFRAFRRFGITRPLWRIHRGIGMGGDTFVPQIAGEQAEREHGDALREAWTEEFDRLIDEVQPFDATVSLLQEVKDRGFRLVLASSGKTRHVEAFLDLFDGRELAEAWTTSDDAEHSKPEPDIVQTALAKVEGASGVLVGDSVYDCAAAGRIGIPTLAVRTGGFSTDELLEAGAARVFDSLEELQASLDDTPLRAPDRQPDARTR
jgi:HAD superfamily hydrolase (TIGR01549 family)